VFDLSVLHWFDLVGISVAFFVAWFLFRRSVRDSELWRATVTPLASIIGSGFLVVAPLLANVVGSAAAFAMLAIVALSFWIGGAIRYNIRRDGRDLISETIGGIPLFEKISDVSLALAYVISVAFYIRLMAAFVLRMSDVRSEYAADALATAVLMFIGYYGSRKGLRGLERLEEYSVTIKLSIIAALLLWLLHHDVMHAYDLSTLHARETNLWDQVRILAGMILVVQGFETSKYLGAAYSPGVRARTMTRAQGLAAFVYVAFIALVMPLMSQMPAGNVSETALIDVTAIVTPLLPPLLIVAAVMSQFSAAVADTLGAGGVVERESKGALTTRVIYPAIGTGAILLLWTTDIFELVAIASRAFAFFYLLQALLAARLAIALERGGRRIAYVSGYAVLSLLMLFVVLYGKAAEA
jgi:hypothetical protein